MEKFFENVKFIDRKSCFIGEEVVIGSGVTIYPNNFIQGKTVIEDGVILLPNNFIDSSVIKSGAKVFASVIENSVVGNDCLVGPFSHLRPESEVGDGCRIGNFVEIKKSVIKEKTKISHLTYVGDALVGKNVNIGCGVVFINYNGKVKNKTTVGDGCFIGSSVNLIAPVNVGDRCYVCAGTTIDKDIPARSFVIGRSRMVVKPFKADKYL